MSPFDAVSRRSVRTAAVPPPSRRRSPWARSFPPRSPRRKRPRCSTASSVLLPRPTPHPRACSSFGFCLHEPVRRALPVTDEASQVPRKELLHVRKVSDCARFSHPSQYAMGDVAFSSAERDRHLGIRPVSQLNTWPVVSPVNASRRPMGDFHLLFVASLPGRTLLWVIRDRSLRDENRSMSAMPRKRRLVVKAPSVAMGQKQTLRFSLYHRLRDL